ncbi:MAG: hypothetical protein LH650_03550 [Chloroflexi bacterium]|nr:hypothetical protein [Chloroflexota bacterium]
MTLDELPADFRAAVDAELEAQEMGPTTRFVDGVLLPDPDEAEDEGPVVYLAWPEEVILPVVREFASLALDRARRDFDIDASVVWFSKALPSDVALLYRHRGRGQPAQRVRERPAGIGSHLRRSQGPRIHQRTRHPFPIGERRRSSS